MSRASKLHRRFPAASAAIPIFALAVLIGCGGGGGGGTSTSGSTNTPTSSTTSSTSTTASTTGTTTGTTTGKTTTGTTTGTTTASTTGTTTGTTTASTTGTTTGTTTASTTGTTTGTTTASTTGTTTTGTTTTGTTTTGTTGTTGSTNGNLPANVVIYNYGDPSAVQVDYVNPNGSSNTAYWNFTSQYLLASPNPQANKFAFAYASNSSVQSYDIYSNTTVSASGATQLTNQGWAFVYSLQYTADGTKIIIVAQTQAGVNNLYVMSANGSNLTTVDNADDAYVSADSNTVCYTKEDSNQNGQIWTTTLSNNSPVQVTNDAWDHFGVQFSKDRTKLAWAAAPNGVSYDIYTATASGGSLTQITNANGDNAVTPTWAPTGSQLSYVLEASSNTALTGVYTVSNTGTGATQIVANPLANSGLFWTTSTGYLLSGHRNPAMIGTNGHVARLRHRGFHIR